MARGGGLLQVLKIVDRQLKRSASKARKEAHQRTIQEEREEEKVRREHQRA